MKTNWLACVATAIGFVSFAYPALAATRYVFTTFKGDAEADEKLWVYTSTDGLNFSLFKNTGYGGTTNVLRDPTLMKHTDGKYYVAYTVYSWTTPSSKFAIASSDDLKQWTHRVDVPVGVTDAQHTWAPEWFIDTDGSVHILVSVGLNKGTPEPFSTHMFTAKDSTLKSWTGPVAIGIGPNYIDTFIVKDADTYHAFSKNETTKYIEHATASSLTGPWKWVGTSNWAGWGSGKEGPALFQLDNGTWRLFMDCYSGCGYLYTDSSDLKSWTAYKTVSSMSGARHGTVLREELSDGGGPVDAGAADAKNPNSDAGHSSQGGRREGAAGASGEGTAGASGEVGRDRADAQAKPESGGGGGGGGHKGGTEKGGGGGTGGRAETGGGGRNANDTGGQGGASEGGGASGAAKEGAAGAGVATAEGLSGRSNGTTPEGDPEAPPADSGCGCRTTSQGHALDTRLGLLWAGLAIALGRRRVRRIRSTGPA